MTFPPIKYIFLQYLSPFFVQHAAECRLSRCPEGRTGWEGRGLSSFSHLLFPLFSLRYPLHPGSSRTGAPACFPGKGTSTGKHDWPPEVGIKVWKLCGVEPRTLHVLPNGLCTLPNEYPFSREGFEPPKTQMFSCKRSYLLKPGGRAVRNDSLPGKTIYDIPDSKLQAPPGRKWLPMP